MSNQWQPIHTAPRDGTEVQLTDGHYRRKGYYARRIETWMIERGDGLNVPTHWFPIPDVTARLDVDGRQ